MRRGAPAIEFVKKDRKIVSWYTSPVVRYPEGNGIRVYLRGKCYRPAIGRIFNRGLNQLADNPPQNPWGGSGRRNLRHRFDLLLCATPFRGCQFRFVA